MVSPEKEEPVKPEICPPTNFELSLYIAFSYGLYVLGHCQWNDVGVVLGLPVGVQADIEVIWEYQRFVQESYRRLSNFQATVEGLKSSQLLQALVRTLNGNMDLVHALDVQRVVLCRGKSRKNRL